MQGELHARTKNNICSKGISIRGLKRCSISQNRQQASRREHERRINIYRECVGDGEYSWNIPTNIFALNCGYFLGNITSREGTPDHFPDRGEKCSDMENRRRTCPSFIHFKTDMF